jgi:predicted MFS family arabinose efflux permease
MTRQGEMIQTRWSSVFLLYGVGLIASSFLGKVAPIGPLLQSDLGLSLAQLGWMVSTITAVAGVLGAAAGFWLAGFGARRALLLGLVILAGAGMLTAVGSSAEVMIAGRVFEGVGYLLVVVAAPTLIVRLSRGPDQASALALWGTFIPVGLAISAFAGGALAAAIGWRGWLSLLGVLPALAVPLVMLAIPAEERQEPSRADGMALSGVGSLSALAAAFSCIGLIGVVMIALLPTFLVEVHAVSLAAAGAATALVSLASVPGSLLAGWLMRRGAGLRALSLCSLIMPAAALPTFLSGARLDLAIGAAAIILIANGVVVSAMFATVPLLAKRPSGVALGNGLIAQLGSLGTLFGPPLFGAMTAAAGWLANAGLILAFTLLGLALGWAAVRR